MTKTLYDPAVEQMGIEKGEYNKALKDAENFLKLGVDEETVSKGTGIPIDKVLEIKHKIGKN